MYKPLVSIIIPVYNGSNYLTEAIESALSQTYENIEIIIVNDGSTDNKATENIALSYKEKIRYIYKENGGVSSALNEGIKHMRGEWFSWLSHDDLYTPDKIEKQIRLISNVEKEKFNYIPLCTFKLIDKDGKNVPFPNKCLTGTFSGKEMMEKFFDGYGINGCALLLSKKMIDKCGDFDVSLKYVQDIDYWFKVMFQQSKFICTKDIMVKNRVHDKQTTTLYPNLYYVEREIIGERVVNQMLNNYSLYRKQLIKFLYLSMKTNDKKTANLIKMELISLGDLNMKIIFQANLYKIRGRIKLTIKKIYQFLFLNRLRTKSH